MNNGIVGPTNSGTDRIVDLQMRSGRLFGLRPDGSVIVPYPEDRLPEAVYTRISAGNSEFCGLRDDRVLVCRRQALPIALASQHFIDLAVDYWGGLCALREDQTLVCDAMDSGVNFGTPPAGKFTRIEALSRGMCGIRVDGSIACFGATEVVVPAGW